MSAPTTPRTDPERRIDGAREERAGLTRALAEVAYWEIGTIKGLTMLPTGPHSAAVPSHWEDEARAKARPYVTAALAYLDAHRPDTYQRLLSELHDARTRAAAAEGEVARLRGVCEDWGSNYQSWVDATQAAEAEVARLTAERGMYRSVLRERGVNPDHFVVPAAAYAREARP